MVHAIVAIKALGLLSTQFAIVIYCPHYKEKKNEGQRRKNLLEEKIEGQNITAKSKKLPFQFLLRYCVKT